MPPSGLAVRPAVAADFEAVAALLAELGRSAPTDENRALLRQSFEHYLGRADTAPLLAELDSRPVGFLSLEFRQRLNRTSEQAWIPDLIVTASARGQGAGRALLDRAIALARERGCWSITLESGTERLAAHQLYLGAGFEDRGKYFLKVL